MTQTQSDDLVTRLRMSVSYKRMSMSVRTELYEAAAEIQRLQAQVAAMHESLAAVTDSLEAEIGDRYKGMLPQLESRYNRDMADVILARVMLASIEGAAG